MEFECNDVSNDNQAGQGLRVNEEIKDDFSEHLSNDEELNLTGRGNVLFHDKNYKTSNRYLGRANHQAEDLEFDDIKEVDHTEEI